MRITHFSNSFIVVRSGGVTLCCDPWVGPGNCGGWHSYPEYDRRALAALLSNTDLVYISHLHDDHFDPKFLLESGLIHKTFIIKNFQIKTLFNRLTRLGASVIELDELTVFKYATLRMAIVPQMASNSSDLEDDVNYDLDTSIVVNDEGVTFFNQVDNPLSRDNCETVHDFIVKEFGSLTVAAFMCGAAGEYPQAFINLDRDVEKARTIASSLDRLKDKLETLKPALYFPAGGTYFIPGKLSGLFKYVAQPSPDQIVTLLKEHDIPTRVCFLEGGSAVTVTSASAAADATISKDLSPVSTSIGDSLAAHHQDLYLHEIDGTAVPDRATIESIFDLARRNWRRVVEQKAIAVSQNMTFVLYSDLSLDENCQPRPEGRFMTLEMSEPGTYPLGELVIHIDVRAFVRCLTRRQVWNGTLFLCLFERRPNVFHPSDTFSLNYLTATEEDVRAR